MREATVLLLTTWQNFYVIIGSSAGALTGLMFVVITLIAGTPRSRAQDPIAAFNTPNVVHFCAALLIAAILCAPWQVLWNASVALGLCGLGGAIYIVIVLRRVWRLTDYTAVLEDWLWHTFFPFVAYTALVVAAIMLPSNAVLALFIVGAATVLLLFVGIHNAWDIVIYIVNEMQAAPEKKSQD